MPQTKIEVVKTQKKHYHVFKLQYGQKATEPLANKIYRCTDPECWYYVKGPLILGKRAICPKCYELFILTRQNLRLAVPHCDKCSKGKKTKEIVQLKENLEDKLKDFFGLEEES